MAKFLAACDTWSGVITWLKLPPNAISPTAEPCTLVIARMSPSVVSNDIGVLLRVVVDGTTLGVTARFDRTPARLCTVSSGAARPQSADAGRSFIDSGASTAEQRCLTFAGTADATPAVETNSIPADTLTHTE